MSHCTCAEATEEYVLDLKEFQLEFCLLDRVKFQCNILCGSGVIKIFRSKETAEVIKVIGSCMLRVNIIIISAGY